MKLKESQGNLSAGILLVDLLWLPTLNPNSSYALETLFLWSYCVQVGKKKINSVVDPASKENFQM